MKQTVEEAASEYMNIPPVRAAIKCSDIEDLESHIKVAFKNGANWQDEQSQWISVKDAIPNEKAMGICQVKYVDGNIDYMVMRHVHRWIYPYIKNGYVTHWRPVQESKD